MKRFACLLGMVALLVFAAPVAAQDTRGSIEGVVKDTSGAVLPGVTIEARSPNAVGVATATSDTAGVYRFPALAPGIYEVSATLAGFQTAKVENVQVAIGQILKIDFPLQVASVSESVSVTAESPIIDVKQNAASATISADVIQRIPKGRDWTSVIATAPGANDESRAGGMQIDGSSGSENRFIVDGMDRTNLRTGTSGGQSTTNAGSTVTTPTVLTDFIQEVQVKSSGYTAEYGGSTGGVISAITKSGSNQFRGSAGSYYRNNNFQSDPRKSWRINPFTDCSAATCTGTPEFLATPDNQFENWNPVGDIGGPIIHDKLWFYFGTSYNRMDNERVTKFRNSLTAQEIAAGATNFASKTMTGWSDSAYYNWNATTRLNNAMNLRFSGSNNRTAQRGSIPSGSDLQPDGSFFADGSSTNGFTTATWDADPEKFKDRWERTGGNGRNDTYAANLDWVITPKLFTNVQVGYYVFDQSTPSEFAGQQLIHSFSTSNTCTGAAGSANCPFPEIPSNLQQIANYSDNKTTSRTLQDLYSRTFVNANTTLFKSFAGEHQFKAGFRFERLYNSADTGAQFPTISLNWNRAFTTADGVTARGTYGYYTVGRSYTQGSVSATNWSFWLQDAWTIKKNFTLNAGVRTENENVPSYDPLYTGISYGFGDKIAPRIGYAWDIKGDGKWKTYASYGKYFDITKLEMPRGSFGADHRITYYYTLDTFNWPAMSCSGEPGSGCPGSYITQVDLRHPANAPDPRLTAYFGHEQNTLDPDLKPVQTGELTFGFDHELGHRMSIGVRYTHKWLDRTIEDSGINIPNVGEVFFIANPGFGVAEHILPEPAPVMPKAQRDYDGVEFRLIKRLGNRWSVNTSYLYSRLYGNYGGLASSDENGRNSPNVDRYFDGLYLLFDKNGDPVYGLLPTDRPHYWKAQLTYDTPWGTYVGVNTQVTSGTPVSTTVSMLGYSPTFINGRGDLGRTPVFSQFDVFLQHEFRFMGQNRFSVNLNVDNLFNQDTVTQYTSTPWRDGLSVPGLSGTGTQGSLSPRDAFIFAGYDPVALVASLRAAGTNVRDSSLFRKPSSFQGRRQLRLGFKYSF
jgi:carboxypeptidase family protein